MREKFLRLALFFYHAISSILKRKIGSHVLRILFGRRLKHLRKQKKLSREKFAEMTDVAPNTVYRWETALDAPEFDRLEKIAEALDIPVKALFDFP